MTSKQTLLKALKEAEGPSRELDAMAAQALGEKAKWIATGQSKEKGKPVFLQYDNEGGGFWQWTTYYFGDRAHRFDTKDEAQEAAKSAPGPWFNMPTKGDEDIIADYSHSPEYTASLDASLALLERVLPGWVGEISTIGCATIARPGIKRPAFHGDADTPALALLIAMVEALIAQEQETE